MRTYKIYKATNLIDGKSYVGKTSNFSERKWQHERCYKKEDCKFHRAIQKYGKENFEWQIIGHANTLEEAYVLEKKYIDLFQTYGTGGYNMTKGGAGGSMWNARPVVRLTLDGNFVSRYDSASEAKKDGFHTNSVIDSCNSNHIRCKDSIFMYEDEYLLNGTRKYEKPKHSCCKAVIQCDLDGNYVNKFQSLTEASKKTGTSRTSISGVLSKKYKTANNFIFVYEKDFPIKNLDFYCHNKKGRKIAQIDIGTNEIINVFDRISDAGKALNVSYKAIHKVVDKPSRTAYGYKWISQ